MCANSSVDRRKYPRHPLPTSVLFYHGPSQHDYPGRCVDISVGGLLMYVPAKVPVQPGHILRLTVGSVNRPEFSGLSEKPIDATVVRVERGKFVSTGHLAVGVRFQTVGTA